MNDKQLQKPGAKQFPMPMLTVDVALLALIKGKLCVALMLRDQAPFDNCLALPGGVVRMQTDQSVEDAAQRMLREKLDFEPRHLEQVVTVSGPARDPRGWSASVLHLALMEGAALEEVASHAALRLVDVLHCPKLAFDHNDLLKMAVQRLQAKATYTSIAGHLLPAKFTLAQLQSVTELLCGQAINKANFRRKVFERGMVRATKAIAHQPGAGRPAELYELVADSDYPNCRKASAFRPGI